MQGIKGIGITVPGSGKPPDVACRIWQHRSFRLVVSLAGSGPTGSGAPGPRTALPEIQILSPASPASPLQACPAVPVASAHSARPPGPAPHLPLSAYPRRKDLPARSPTHYLARSVGFTRSSCPSSIRQRPWVHTGIANQASVSVGTSSLTTRSPPLKLVRVDTVTTS